MSTLRIIFDGDDHQSQDVEILNLRARELSVSDAVAGFRPSPDLLIILPTGNMRLFEIGSGVREMESNTGMIVSGQTRVRLVRDPQDTDDDDAAMPVLEIGAMINGVSRLKDLLELPCLLDLGTSDTLMHLHRSLIKMQPATGDHEFASDMTRHLIAGQTVNALLAMSEKTNPGKIVDDQAPSQINRLKKFMFKNLHRKVTTADMAAEVGMSRQHFCQWAKPLLGKTPALFLRELRLERGMDRLLNSNDSIESIAEQIGYADRYHFGKEFKTHFGTSPAKLRKQHTQRRDSHASHVSELIVLVKYREALALCEASLETPGLTTSERNQLKLLRGRCFKAMNEYDKAMNAWEQLRDSAQGWEAGMLRCQYAFECDQSETALEEMAHLWAREGANRHDLIKMWMQQVTLLRIQQRTSKLRKYLDFRREHFIDDETSSHAALCSLRGIGSDLEVLEQCPTARGSCFLALRRAGLYDRALAEYGDAIGPTMIARLYFETGEYERVLDIRPLQPTWCVRAMVEMGQAQEAIDAFPDNCAQAYLALKDYDGLLRMPHETSLEKAFALIERGRTDELNEMATVKGSFHDQYIRCHLDPESLLREKFPNTGNILSTARCLTVVKRMMEGREAEARQLLETMESVSSPNVWPWHHSPFTLLFPSILKGILGRRKGLIEDLKLITDTFRYLSRQRLYYDAAFLRGDVDADGYQSQPRKDEIYDRLTFIRAVRHDLAAHADEACKGYRELVETTTTFETDSLLRHRFSEWRLKELG